MAKLLFGILAMTACLAANVASVAADDLTSVSTVLSSARSSAIGGPHAALADDLTSLFNNPAGFASARQQIAVSALSMQLSGPVFDIAGIVSGGLSGGVSKVFENPNVQDLLQSIYASMNMVGPVYFGYVGNGLGFGIFNSTKLTIMNTAPLTIGAGLGEQLLLSGGYAFRVPLPSELDSTLDIGLSLKGVFQGTFEIDKSLLELPSFVSSIGLSSLTDSPFVVDLDMGLDAGIRYAYRDIFSIGIVGRNIYTPGIETTYSSGKAFWEGSDSSPSTTNTLLPLDLSVGTLFTPKLGFLGRYVSDLKIMLDYDDALGFLTHAASARNPWLNIGFGTEITLLQILNVRGGFYEGLFNAGLGLDLKYFRIDAAMFGTELSTEPGLNPAFNVIIALTFLI